MYTQYIHIFRHPSPGTNLLYRTRIQPGFQPVEPSRSGRSREDFLNFDRDECAEHGLAIFRRMDPSWARLVAPCPAQNVCLSETGSMRWTLRSPAAWRCDGGADLRFVHAEGGHDAEEPGTRTGGAHGGEPVDVIGRDVPVEVVGAEGAEDVVGLGKEETAGEAAGCRVVVVPGQGSGGISIGRVMPWPPEASWPYSQSSAAQAIGNHVARALLTPRICHDVNSPSTPTPSVIESPKPMALWARVGEGNVVACAAMARPTRRRWAIDDRQRSRARSARAEVDLDPVRRRGIEAAGQGERVDGVGSGQGNAMGKWRRSPITTSSCRESRSSTRSWPCTRNSETIVVTVTREGIDGLAIARVKD